MSANSIAGGDPYGAAAQTLASTRTPVSTPPSGGGPETGTMKAETPKKVETSSAPQRIGDGKGRMIDVYA